MQKQRKPLARRIAVWLSTGLLVVGVGTIGTFIYWAKVEHRFLPVTQGQLYRSGEMPPDALKAVVRKHRIRTVIDLRHDDPAVEVERAAMTEIGVKYINIPSRQVPTDDVVKAFLAAMDEVMGNPERRPVLIHCKDGVGRAPLFSAIYRMEYEGWSNEDARSTAYWRTIMGNFRPNSRKGRFILNYSTRLRSAG